VNAIVVALKLATRSNDRCAAARARKRGQDQRLAPGIPGRDRHEQNGQIAGPLNGGGRRALRPR
jgi:hypothetical protein